MSVCQPSFGMMLSRTTTTTPSRTERLVGQIHCRSAGSGTGRMLLLASNVSLSLHRDRKDALVRTACLINGALYALACVPLLK